MGRQMMKNDLFDLQQETAVVMGGTGALGGAMAEALAAAGARVAIVGRSAERGQERVRSIESTGGQALFQSADALDRDSLLRARVAILKQWNTVSVRVNAISPGFFPAEQNRAMLFKPDGGYTERGQQIIGHTPMARFGDPKELAGAVVWLAASRASSFVTGQNIVVDGGFSAITI